MNFLHLGKVAGFFRFDVDYKKGLLFSFLLGFGLRMIPEVLAFPYPISWDAMHYAYFMKVGVVWRHWSSFFTSTWLLYAFLVPLQGLFGVNEFLLLKIVGPVLFGLNVAGVCWFAKNLLGWSSKWSLLAGGFFAVQLASLRISWEFLRNTLGLALLLFTLPFIKKLDSKRGFLCFVGFSLLTAFAHEYAAVTLLAISLTLVFSGLLIKKERKDREAARRLMFAVLPALLIFLVGLYLRMFPIPHEKVPLVGPKVVWAEDTVHQSYGKLFFLVNYIGMDTGLDIYPNYSYLALSVLALFAVLYLPYFYLVWKGFFRDSVLDRWTGLLLVGSLNCLVTPFFALDLWHRWMFMLVYPFTFYAVNGMKRLCGLGRRGVDSQKDSSRLGRKVLTIFLVTVLIGAVYLSVPVLMASIGFGSPSLFSIGRYFTTAPTVPYEDIDGVIQAMDWLNGNMKNGSVALLHNAFVAWAKLYLGSSHDVIGYKNDVNSALTLALQNGYNNIYFVGWSEGLVNWYGVYVPEHFVQLDAFERISVFEYTA